MGKKRRRPDEDPEKKVRALEALLKRMEDKQKPRTFTVFRKTNGYLTTDPLEASRPSLPGVAHQPQIEHFVLARSAEEAISLADQAIYLEEDSEVGALRVGGAPPFADPLDRFQGAVEKPAVLVSCAGKNFVFFVHEFRQAKALLKRFDTRGCGPNCAQEHEIRVLTPDEAQMLGADLWSGMELFVWLWDLEE